MYTDKQALYESFLSRGFDDACARLMAGLDPATVMEAKTPEESNREFIENKKSEIYRDYNTPANDLKRDMTKLKGDIATEYDELDKIIEKYRSESGKSNNKNGTGGSSDTQEPEEGYTADSSKTKGSDEHIEKIANNWDNYSKEEQEEIKKSMSEDDRHKLIAALMDYNRFYASHPEAFESVNFLGETILPDEEWFNKNKKDGNENGGAKNIEELKKHWNEYSKEEKRKIYNSLSEDDQYVIDGIEMQMAYPEQQQDDGINTKGRYSDTKKETQSTNQERSAEHDGVSPAGKQTNNDGADNNNGKTDNSSTTHEPEADYNAGSPNPDSSTKQKPKKSTNRGKETFPPLDYEIGDGKILKDLVLSIRKKTFRLFQLAIQLARLETDNLWRLRHIALIEEKASKAAIKKEKENYSEPSEREIYNNIFDENGRGMRTDVFRIKEFRI